MAFDKELELRALAAFNGAPNTNVAGSFIAIGRSGLPPNAQFVVAVKTLAGTAGDSPNFKAVLQITLDNNTTRRDIATIDFGDPSAGFDGKIAQFVGRELNTQEYTAANIKARVILVPTSSNVSNNVTAAAVGAWIAVGENTRWGRKRTADTLAT